MKNKIILISIITLICLTGLFSIKTNHDPYKEKINIAINTEDIFFYSEYWDLIQKLKEEFKDDNLVGDFSTKWDFEKEYHYTDKQYQYNSIEKLINNGLDYIVLELSDESRRTQLDNLFKENNVKVYYLDNNNLKPYYEQLDKLVSSYKDDVDEIIYISKENISKNNVIDISNNSSELDTYVKNNKKNTLYVCDRSWNVYELIRILNKYNVDTNQIITLGTNNYIRKLEKENKILGSVKIDEARILKEILNDVEEVKNGY